MAPNAGGNQLAFQEDQEVDSEENQYEQDDPDTSGLRINQRSHSSQPSVSCLDTTLKVYLLRLLFSMKYYIKKLYVIVWHELSMDPAVRSSPFTESPENEIKLPTSEKFAIRRRRIFFILIHFLALVGLFYCLTGRVKLYTIVWAILLGSMSSIGATAGAHRLWSHHSFKATWQLRVILIIFQTLSVQYSAYNWARDHRLHHRFTDTEADPHNSNRGFFFSHIGWAVILPRPEVEKHLKDIDMSDIERDKVAMFQYKYYVPLCILLAYVLPTLIPWYFWGENLWISHLVAAQLRHIVTLHGTFLINSAAHMWGIKPYDKNINPTENMLVSFATFGDGWHNYHHVFPWDYKNAELLNYKLNISTAFIDLFALIGWAYDLKTVSKDVVNKRAKRTGDGSHLVWGWNDSSLTQQDKDLAEIRFQKSN